MIKRTQGLLVFFILSTQLFAQEQENRQSPDCWSAARNVHYVDMWQELSENNISYGVSKMTELKDKTFSPNKGYYFNLVGWRHEASLSIYAEKEYLIMISFKDISGINQPVWINEKLIFISVWWGRIAATDLIYDVEREEVIYLEDKRDESISFNQHKEMCFKVGGCDCITKN